MTLPICGSGGSNLLCTVAEGRGIGDPVKPYIDAWVVLPLVIVAFVIGRMSRRKS